MREIKFRAWNKNKKIMCYNNEDDSVDYHWDGDESTTINHLNWYISDNRIYDFMQYTGLKDKNGTEIYEGDIVTGLYGRPKFVEIKRNYTKWDIFCNDTYYGLPTHMDIGEVVGDIYEHSHLLK